MSRFSREQKLGTVILVLLLLVGLICFSHVSPLDLLVPAFFFYIAFWLRVQNLRRKRWQFVPLPVSPYSPSASGRAPPQA